MICYKLNLFKLNPHQSKKTHQHDVENDELINEVL